MVAGSFVKPQPLAASGEPSREASTAGPGQPVRPALTGPTTGRDGPNDVVQSPG